MANREIELKPVDFITIGTVGPKGQRVFYLQAGKEEQVVSLTIEKEQASALGEAIKELLSDLEERYPGRDEGTPAVRQMELREPLVPEFRVAQMGLGYDEDQNLVVLVAQELLTQRGDDTLDISAEASVVRMWCTRAQMRALSEHSNDTVAAGRPDVRMNGRLVYYWT
jgi:uncharacterized repeat protein (TIGR03847 family)